VSSRALLGGAVLLGAALRLHGIRDQLLLSDEWHAPHAAALTSARELLTLVTFGATSIPMNVYTRLLLDGPGWSELGLRLPSLAAGLASLLLFPLLARDLLRPRATVLFAYLVALSPFLVFYTRYARPYSLVVLLAFASLVACHRWARSGKTRDAVVFAGSGVLAGWLHVPEVRSIFLPLLPLLVLRLGARSGPERSRVRPSVGTLLLVGLVAAGLFALLLLPGFLDASQSLTPVIGRARPDATTLLGVIELVSGTARPVACGAFLAFAVLGFVIQARRHRLWALLLLVVTAGGFLMVLLARPFDSHIPIVFARYVIVVLPLAMMAVASGIDGVLAWAESRSPLSSTATRAIAGSAAAGMLAVLFWLGPLPRIYAGRNDFTNHKAFQASYGPLGVANPYTRGFASLIADGGARTTPAFYDRLAAEPGCAAVVEYPLPIGDLYSPYFLYQARHQRRVLGGYLRAPSRSAADTRPGIVHAEWAIDQVLGQIRDPAKLRFRNLVDLGDPAAMRACGACYLVVHTDLAAELDGACRRASPASLLGPDYVRRFGEPAFVDACTTVFDLRTLPE